MTRGLTTPGRKTLAAKSAQQVSLTGPRSRIASDFAV